MISRRGRTRCAPRRGGVLVVAVLVACAIPARVAGLDPTFGPQATAGIVRFPGNGATRYQRGGIAVWPDGSLVASNGSEVHKFTVDGVADPSFGPPTTPGLLNIPCAQTSDLAVDAVGRLIVAITSGCTGTGGGMGLAFRFSASGVLDAGFDGTIGPSAIFGSTTIVDTTGAVVVSSSGNGGACLYRFGEADGLLDPTFGGTTPGRACVADAAPFIQAVGAVRADGGFLLVVSDSSPTSVTTTSVTRFSHEGVAEGPPAMLDLGTFSIASDVAATPDGGFLLAGNSYAPTNAAWIKHFDASGNADPTFNSGGSQPGTLGLGSGGAWSITPFPDGRFALAGSVDQAAQALLITGDGRTDAALESGSRTPGKLTLLENQPIDTHTSVFSTVAVWNGRLVISGVEWDHPTPYDAVNTMAIVARSDVVGAANLADTALFRATPPTRVLDTRPGSGQLGYIGPKPVAGSTFDLQITGRAGVPTTGVGAVAMNLTATEATAAGYVTVWPSGGARPVVSSLNLENVGQTLPNLVIVPIGSGGKISLFTQSGTHLVADVLGWFPALGGIQTVTPTRILETRPGPDQTGYVGPKPTTGQTLSVQVAGRVGLPLSGVRVAIVNLTMTEANAPGYVTAWASGTARPMVASNLNVARAGQTIQNLVMVPLGDDGAFDLFTMSGGHLIVDLVGWLPQGSGYRPNPLANPRVLDTRPGAGGPLLGPIAAGGVVQVGGNPSSIVVVNVVAVDATGPGYLTAYPSDTTRPLASNLNVEFAGQTIANSVIVTTNANGTFDLFTQSGAQLVVDLVGSFPLPG